MAEIAGLLIIDKPEGITSHDVVARVRRALRMKRIGHAGTLDPIATGVLVLCLGKATRLQQFFMGSDKEYIARIRLGFATDTYDRTGNPISPVTASKGVMEEQIQWVLDDLRGTREQLPPMFSAKKQAGTRLYKLARRGEEVLRTPVRVMLHEVKLLPEDGEVLHRNDDGTSDFSLFVKYSAGAYVRSLAHEIGQRLGCGGHIIALRRTAAGDFRVDQAIPLEEFERLAQSGEASERVIPLADAPLNLLTITLSPAEAERLRHGQPVRRESVTDGAYCKLVDARDRLIAVGQMMAGEGVIRPRIVLY
ncbi:MAG: tRNA pseudouridine(55) synthase TruB [Acidobacteria bacterium]|nr:tRNA pseudouridine(55) synthase TruB [Acidobacteriota bacterium]